MRRYLAAGACWLLLGWSAWAQEVQIGDQLLFKVSNDKQAKAISTRIENLMLEDTNPSTLRLAKVKTGIAVYWGKIEIVVVTAELAKANGSDPKALAARWLERVRQVAQVGMLKLNPGRLEMPIGGEASVEVGGLATGQMFFQESSGRVQVFEESGSRLRVQAKQVGKTQVVIQRGRARVSFFVHVKDLAGRVPESVQVRVTGDPAPGELVTEAILRSLQSQSRVNPGCKLTLDFPPAYAQGVPSVPDGGNMTVSVIARISGSEDYYPVRKEVRVSAQSLKVDPVEPVLLLVSNRPEQVKDDGILLEYALSAKEPSRLMYSHMNASEQPRNLWVNLNNPSSEPIQVLVDWTFSGPHKSEVHVGHQAAMRFVERLAARSGFVLDIPANTRMELADHVVGYRQLLSGFAGLRLLKGDKLEVQVLSKLAPGRNDGSKVPALGAPFNPFKIHPHGVFAQPFFEEWLDYAVGGQPLSFNFGESPWLIDFETGLPNTGNFGVIYHWNVKLTNPSKRPTRVGLFFTPKNGAAALSLQINKQVVSVPFTQRNEEAPVRAFPVNPGQEVTVDLTTLPEASSSYPATLEFRELRAGEPGPPDFRP